MKQNIQGFTVLELIVVVVLLAILAVTALPKYLNLSSSARINTMQAVSAAMRASADQVKFQTYLPSTPKEFIASESNDGLDVYNVTIEELGVTVKTYNAHVDGHWRLAWQHILDIGKEIEWTPANAVCTKHDLCGVGNQRTAPGFPHPNNTNQGLVLVWPEGFKLSDLCYAYYNNPEDGSEPNIGTVTSGC